MRHLASCAIGAACFLLPISATAQPGQATGSVGAPPQAFPGKTATDEGKAQSPCRHASSEAISRREPFDTSRSFDADTDVLHYDLDIEIIPEYSGGTATAVGVRGISTIDVQALVDDLDHVVVDLASDLAVDGVSGAATSWDRPADDADTIILQLDKPYSLGEAFSITVAYSGYPARAGFGAFAWWYRGDDLFVATLSQPYYAHYWWPCKDTLDDKATMAMHVTVPKGMVAVSNGGAMGAEVLSDGRVRWNWAETYPMITYLASIAAGPYQRYDLEFDPDGRGTGSPMPVPCYLYPDHWDFDTGLPTEENKAGCDEIPTILDTFSGVFGPYPFLEEKYGVVETGGGGLSASMEHQTISSMTQVAWYSDIMAHELAHQWWGDEVTCQTWEDIWLNEGFATYSEALYREFQPDGGMDGYWDRMNQRKPPNPDAQVYRTSTSDVDDIFSLNDVYQKGAWVLHMLRHVLGDDTFFQVLADYREIYRHDSATTEEFTLTASLSSGQDLSWFIDEWVMRPGSPDYVWRYETRRAGDRLLLVVSISQTQSKRGYGLITMPIDLYIETEASTQTVRLWNDTWRAFYVIPLDAPPVTVALDQADGNPDRRWILGHSMTWSNAPIRAVPAPMTEAFASRITARPARDGDLVLPIRIDDGKTGG